MDLASYEGTLYESPKEKELLAKESKLAAFIAVAFSSLIGRATSEVAEQITDAPGWDEMKFIRSNWRSSKVARYKEIGKFYFFFGTVKNGTVSFLMWHGGGFLVRERPIDSKWLSTDRAVCHN